MDADAHTLMSYLITLSKKKKQLREGAKKTQKEKSQTTSHNQIF